MRDSGLGPPEKERPGGYQAARPDRKSATTTDKPTINAAPRQCRCNTRPRRHADAVEWFRRGWRDALRCAAREVDDPHVWLVLAELADRYSDDDPNGYALVGGGR